MRLQNWFYINVPQGRGLRFTGYFLAFGTVIPAIYLTTRLLDRILPGHKGQALSLKGYPGVALPLGLASLAFALAFPVYCFALAWVFLSFSSTATTMAPVIRPLQAISSGAPEADPGGGRIRHDLRLFVGVLELLVDHQMGLHGPFLRGLKLFEMPAPGFLGFAFFALETMAFLTLLRSSPILSRSKWSLSVLALSFCFVSFLLIDHYTVFSHTARVDSLPFLSDSDRAAIEAAAHRRATPSTPGCSARKKGNGWPCCS